ncbi:calcineurin-like phosphoesterase C-terminal domain-containing protein [Xanthomonas hortorum]|uniref:calcineurin-like phosphoesterase C-terminal domain-containing protein n=1 Tax=Xanthomonas hortorum TaxID=56454 RepID=UPI0015D5FBA7|nr:calcineurin-like phosphoesterase family protein [Xanthomonas hortorum]MCE4360194.1 calcineurin-like phosphoesterase family protein [Xanthomonas hortorum pv. taraxaci]NMI51740.1 calcineurin phosphoesterase [Xanthomonas hortorum pv. taraxaci]CAD0336306.1 3',5'-cyclic adenosine monophosphate phosphodiesterase CpdA [Xanthomonas hortorum pv. taraxaci]CAD0336316.1 3',5'-cyclic adenosine monophosphate phosphodiesterase CpdA [Xanthomonas hortorum pv. taraxaci]
MQLRIALLALGLLAGSAYARDAVVDGIVYEERDGHAGRSADDPGIAGVTVSNGEQLVRTDAQGRYRLPVRDGQTVFVIKPGDRSFVPTADGLPGFWRHYAPNGSAKRKYPGIAATGRNTHSWDFALTPRASAAADGFQMLVFADSQTASLVDVGYYQRDIVAPIVGKTSAKLGTTLGDIVSDDLSLYPALNKVTTQLGVPWFHVPGNHDLNFDAGDDVHSLDSWRAVYGPDTYAVEEANASFVFLDDVIYTPGAKPAYVGGLREDQFVFLQAYLAQLPRERLLVLGMHIPLFDAAPGQETFRHADRSRLFALLKEFPHVLVLSGHSHTQRQVDHGADEGWQGAKPLHEYNVGAACGAFWSGAKDGDGIPTATMSDGTPNGYAVLQVAPSGDYTLAYHAARLADDAQLLLQAPKVLRQGAYAAWGIYANVFMGQDDTVVQMRIDNGAWQPMKRVERADPRLLAENVRDDAAEQLRGYDRSPEATPSTHLWRGALPTTLEVGEHTVEVRAALPTGEYSANTVYRLQRADP